jgi:hypothetical protein
MIPLDQVPMWLTLRWNIGHALVQTKSGWHLTVCGKWTPNGGPTPERPGRICRTCRARLALTPQREEAGHGE